MKKQLRKLVRSTYDWPVIGQFVRRSVAIIRRCVAEFRARQHSGITMLLQKVLEVVDLKQTNKLVVENFVKSVPVALRKLTQDQADIKNQLDSLSGFSTNLFNRIEFVRRELMFEMRYGASSPLRGNTQNKIKTEILRPDKLAEARASKMRLNLGCGHISLDSYLNVDRRNLSGVDIVAEVDSLPFEMGEIDEIFSAHLLEHFPEEQLRRELLPYWVGLLRMGGEFRAVVPDANAMIRSYVDGSCPYSFFREVTFGAQDYDGDFHFNMFVPDQLSFLLTEAGLTDVEVISQGRKNGKCFEMELRAFRK